MSSTLFNKLGQHVLICSDTYPENEKTESVSCYKIFKQVARRQMFVKEFTLENKKNVIKYQKMVKILNTSQ